MQRSMLERARAVLAGLGCALCASVTLAQETQASFAVWAIGLPNGYVTMEHSVPSIQVTAEDIARGEVRVRGGSRIVIATTTPGRYDLVIRGQPAFAGTAWVEGLGRVVEITLAGATIVRVDAAAGRQVLALDYRFALAPEVIPGTYPWPLRLDVQRALEPVTGTR